MVNRVNRRRFLTISAAAVATPALGGTKAPIATFRANALGASVKIRLSGLTQSQAAETFGTLENELFRLENIFSLYRPNSELSRLNRTGSLIAPSPEMREVLGVASTMHHVTGGAFDPTIQPVWNLYAATNGQPGKDTLAKVWALTGWRNVRVEGSQVTLQKKGSALTLNGIAQGFITDRVSDILTHRGFTNVLIDAGEIRANGEREAGLPWRVGIRSHDGTIARRLELTDRAIATSSPSAQSVLPGAGVHILDARRKGPALSWQSVSVSAEKAVVADALSTAFTSMSREEIARALSHITNARLEYLG